MQAPVSCVWRRAGPLSLAYAPLHSPWRPSAVAVRPAGSGARSRWVRLAIRGLGANFRSTEAATHGHDPHDRWHGDLLQGLGLGPTNRLQPWLAPFGRRLGHPAAVLPAARLSGDRPRPPGA